MKLKASCIPLTLAAMLLSGCQPKASFDPGSAGSFFPLRPGSTWTYRITDNDRHTTEILTDHAVGDSGASPSDVGGGVVSEHEGPGGENNLTILYKVENGYVTRIFDFGGAGGVQFRERGFLPSLLKPDLTWSNWAFPFGSFREAFHLSQTHHTALETAPVVVPAGIFSNCIRIETRVAYEGNLPEHIGPRRLKYLDWYAPRVGLIKTVVIENGYFGAEVARVELLSFGDSPVKTVSNTLPPH
jgi:hypothetical protein